MFLIKFLQVQSILIQPGSWERTSSPNHQVKFKIAILFIGSEDFIANIESDIESEFNSQPSINLKK